MHNTIITCMLALMTAVSASAQFHTIDRDHPIEREKKAEKTYMTDIQQEKAAVSTIEAPTAADKPSTTENSSVVENIRKGNRKKSRESLLTPVSPTLPGVSSMTDSKKFFRISEAMRYENKIETSSLPELTVPNLLAEIERNGIRHPKIVLAQAILETGWFRSSVCRNKHNLFGLTNPRTGKYYEFSHWTESVRAYYTKVQYRYDGKKNYLLWLRDIGYAEDPGYIRAIIRVLRRL